MVKKLGYYMIATIMLFSFVVAGCGSKSAAPGSTDKGGSTAGNTASAPAEKAKPDTMTDVKIATVSNTIDFLPWYVAEKKGIFSKYNLKVNLNAVDGSVTAVRGLRSGDFQFIAGLPESIISAVAEGGNVKMVGTLANQTLFSIFVSPEINKVEDLKGKVAGVLGPGNGTDTVVRWWLKKHGLEPDKDIRIISAGSTPARLTALTHGQVQLTVLQPPNDIQGEKAGMKRFAKLSDELKTYNQDVISANGNVIKDKPEMVRAFLAATSEAIQYIKDTNNRKEVIKIGMESIGTDEDVTTKSLDFVLPVMPDKAKLNVEGVKWAIDALKEVGTLKTDISLDKVMDESFYAK